MRIEQVGAEKEVTVIKIQHADEIDLQTEQPDVFGGQKSFQDTHNGKHRVRQIQQQSELDRNDRRRAPTQLGHGTNNEVIFLLRQALFNVANDPGDIGDDIFGKENAFDGVGANPFHQCVNDDHAVEPKDSAHAIKRESEAQLNRGKLRRDNDQQREARGAVRHLGVDNADCLN